MHMGQLLHVCAYHCPGDDAALLHSTVGLPMHGHVGTAVAPGAMHVWCGSCMRACKRWLHAAGIRQLTVQAPQVECVGIWRHKQVEAACADMGACMHVEYGLSAHAFCMQASGNACRLPGVPGAEAGAVQRSTWSAALAVHTSAGAVVATIVLVWGLAITLRRLRAAVGWKEVPTQAGKLAAGECNAAERPRPLRKNRRKLTQRICTRSG